MAPPALCVSMAHRTSDMSDSDDNDVDDVLVMDLVPTPAISSASSSLSVRLPPPPAPPPPASTSPYSVGTTSRDGVAHSTLSALPIPLRWV
jgi:hypothetical protein